MDLHGLYGRLHGVGPVEAEAEARRYGAARSGPIWAVSACLLGVPCRYDGLHRGLPDPERLLLGRAPLPLCPEVLAGLGVPRSPMTFDDGDGAAALAGRARLVSAAGRDCTAALAAGAALAMRLARAAGCQGALLKARSPSCGVRRVHSSTGLIPGRGMFAALCLEAGFAVRTEEDPPVEAPSDP